MHRNYVKRLIESPLPPLAEDERIYLKVPYMARSFAKYCHCRFDSERNFGSRELITSISVVWSRCTKWMKVHPITRGVCLGLPLRLLTAMS